VKILNHLPPIPYSFKGTFPAKDRQFAARFFPMSVELFVSLGFRPDKFASGCMVGAMENSEYEALSEAHLNTSTGGIFSFHPNNANPEAKEVLTGQRDYLSNERRVILVPQSCREIILTHELAHDIYLGGGISKEARDEFAREILSFYRSTIDPKKEPNLPLQAFFATVLSQCFNQKALDHIKPNYPDKSPLNEAAFQVFASECFAYGVEKILFPERSVIKEIPTEIRRSTGYLKAINPKTMINLMQQQAIGRIKITKRHHQVRGRIELSTSQPPKNKTKVA